MTFAAKARKWMVDKVTKIPKYFYFRVHANKDSIELEDASDVDVVEVIRCKDCKYNSNPPEYGNAVCDTFYGMTDQMGYCHYGEPRDEELGSGEQ